MGFFLLRRLQLEVTFAIFKLIAYVFTVVLEIRKPFVNDDVVLRIYYHLLIKVLKAVMKCCF